MREAKACGCDAVKFQKRTVDLVYTKEELANLRDSPFEYKSGFKGRSGIREIRMSRTSRTRERYRNRLVCFAMG